MFLLWSVWVTPDFAFAARADAINPNAIANAVEGDDTLHRLDINAPTFSQPIDRGDDGASAAKFVQVEVAEVRNPKRYGLTFEVRYQPDGAAQVYLGSFSLFPADNPGRFIVATQGKVKDKGAIVLSMVITDKVDAGDQVAVGVKKMKFIKG